MGSAGAGNMPFSSSSLGPEADSMQTLRKPRPKATGADEEHARRFVTPGSTFVVGAIFLLAFLFLVQQMAGFDGDTVFLAVYCTIVATFCFQSIADGLGRKNG